MKLIRNFEVQCFAENIITLCCISIKMFYAAPKSNLSHCAAHKNAQQCTNAWLGTALTLVTRHSSASPSQFLCQPKPIKVITSTKEQAGPAVIGAPHATITLTSLHSKAHNSLPQLCPQAGWLENVNGAHFHSKFGAFERNFGLQSSCTLDISCDLADTSCNWPVVSYVCYIMGLSQIPLLCYHISHYYGHSHGSSFNCRHNCMHEY